MEDRERFEDLYRAYVGAVAGYVRRRSDGQTADDVVADVFVIAWRRLPDIPDDPLPWLLAVARRTLANRRRSLARDAALRTKLSSLSARWMVPPDAAVLADEAVVQALAKLNDRDRETLLLVAWEGLTPTRAARVLGVRPNTFAARLARARRRLARVLEDESKRSGAVHGATGTEVL